MQNSTTCPAVAQAPVDALLVGQINQVIGDLTILGLPARTQES